MAAESVLKEAEVTEALPLFPLGTVLFPGMVLPLHIFEPRYRAMIADRMNDDPMFGVVRIRRGREVGDEPEIFRVGTAASLVRASRHADGRYDIVVAGARRFLVHECHWDASYMTGSIVWLDDLKDLGRDRQRLASLRDAVKDAFHNYARDVSRAGNVQVGPLELADDPISVAYAICATMPFSRDLQQHLLEVGNPAELLRELLARLRQERTLLAETGIGGSAIERPTLTAWE